MNTQFHQIFPTDSQHMAAAEAPDPPSMPSASIREYLDAVVVDEAHTIFEQCLDPFVRTAMAAAFPELSTDPYTIQFAADLAAHQARLHEIDTVELPAALKREKELPVLACLVRTRKSVKTRCSEKGWRPWTRSTPCRRRCRSS